MRTRNNDEGVTPQSYLRQTFYNAIGEVNTKLEAAKKKIISQAMVDSGTDAKIKIAQEAWQFLTGNHLDTQYYTDPQPNSPLGVMVAKTEALKDKLEAAYEEASLRVNLGKGADEKMKELKAFSAVLGKMLKEVK